MPYMITLVLIILGLWKKKSKILFCVQFLWAWILLGWNNGGIDYKNYIDFYYYIGKGIIVDGGSEKLFYELYRYMNIIGLDFREMLIIVSFICLFLISSTVWKYTKNRSFVMSLFFIYPLVENVIQQKNFIAFAIIIFSIRYLMANSKLSTVKYIVCVAIATMFHSSALIYIILLLVKWLRVRRLKILALCIAVGCMALYPILPLIAATFASSDMVYNYFYNQDNKTSIYKSIVFAVWQLVSMLIVFYFVRDIGKLDFTNKSKVLEIGDLNGVSVVEERFKHLVYSINIVFTFLLVMYFYNSTFTRIYRNIMILNFVFISQYKVKNAGITVYILYLISSVVYLDIISGDNFNIVFRPVFENNAFFEWISFLFYLD